MVVGWMQFIPTTQSWEAYLVVREPNGTDWEALGGSDSGGGISGAEGPSFSNTMAMALGPDGTPFVAYDSMPTRGTDFASAASGIAADRDQIYVKRWAGPAQGWVFVGSGREGGGASNARELPVQRGSGFGRVRSGAARRAQSQHRGRDRRPAGGHVHLHLLVRRRWQSPTFNGLNDDIYVTQWNGTTWVAVGPPVPTGPGRRRASAVQGA